MKKSIIFSGLSKNCISTVTNNIEFLYEFILENSNLDIKLLIIDSDSTDGTKDYVSNICIKNNNIKLINIDSIESKFTNRVDRIAYCRNAGLNFIEKYYAQKNILYIPMDLDIDLFKYITKKQLTDLISVMGSNEKSCQVMLPCSTPYYYDIFALRASGWIDFNVQKIVYYLKKYIKIGSFFWNYIFIFRYQWPVSKVQNQNFILTSAFGGIGIYSIEEFNINQYSYPVHDGENLNFNSEHIEFNRLFEKLEININWLIPAPEQHIEYLSSDFKNKIKYILRTLKYDFLNITSYG